MKEGAESLIEAAHAAESRSEGDVRHGHSGFVNEMFGKEHSSSLRDGNRRGAEVLKKKSAQVPLAESEALGKFLDRGSFAVEGSVIDEGEGARNRIRSTLPRSKFRGGFRPAAKAGTKARFLGRGGRTKETAILRLRRTRRTDGPAVHTRGANTDEDQPVETGIAAL
jgi:hypothetical protein